MEPFILKNIILDQAESESTIPDQDQNILIDEIGFHEITDIVNIS